MECCICYDKYSLITFKCKHNICLKCIVKVKNTNCPYCRKNLIDEIPKEILEIINKNENNLNTENIIHNLLIQLRNIDINLYNYFIEKIDNGEEICEYYLRDLISARAESIAIQTIIENKI